MRSTRAASALEQPVLCESGSQIFFLANGLKLRSITKARTAPRLGRGSFDDLGRLAATA